MRTLYLILILFITTINITAQVTQEWLRVYSYSNAEDDPSDMATDNAGGIIVTGKSYSQSTNNLDYATVKYNTAGVQQWASRYNGSENNHDHPNAVTSDIFGNIFVTGYSTVTGTNEDIATVKYNSSGAEQWIRKYTGTGSGIDRGMDIIADASGSVYMCGTTQTGAVTGTITIKYDASGTQVWAMSYAPSNTVLPKLKLDSQGNVIVVTHRQNGIAIIKYSPAGTQQWITAHTSSSLSFFSFDIDASNNIYITALSGTTGSNSYIIKYNSDGVEQWTRNFSGYSADVAVDNAGNAVFTGNMSRSTQSPLQVMKYNSAGTLLWTARDSSLKYEKSVSISCDALNNIYIAGSYIPEGGQGNTNMVTLKYNSSGIMEWFKTYGGGDIDRSVKVIARNNNEVYTLGNSVQSMTFFAPDMVTIKYYSLTGIQQTGNIIPSKFTLYQNYPNPFNPETNIKFDLPEASNVKITIYNSLGKEMQVLADEHKQAGSYEVKFNSEEYAGGVYFYRIEAGNYIETKKMILIK